MAQKPLLDRIATKFTVGDGCWEWTGSVSADGYARVGNGGRQWLAHRLMYEMLVGPIPKGLDLDHLCRVRHCIRPSHCEPVTRKENLRRGLNGVLKTHCVHGHEYTPENTYLSGKKGRVCRTCTLASQKAQRDAEIAARPPKTRCKRGHDLTDESNIYIWRNCRHCKACRLLAKTAYLARKAER